MTNPIFTFSPVPSSSHPMLVQQQLGRLIAELLATGITAHRGGAIRYGEQLQLTRGAGEATERGHLVVYYAKGKGLRSVQYQGPSNALVEDAKAFLEALLPRFVGRNGDLAPAMPPLW